jgi:RsiW-degrading membrane proteinase PrsW (M82 family)
METAKIKGLFSKALVNHTAEYTETYFIAGTPQTTPDIVHDVPQPPRPWFFIRVLFISVVAFLGFYIGVFYFSNPNFLPGLIFFGAFITPISLLIFFWEVNMLRNISIYRLTIIVIMGGIVSLLYTVTIYSLIDGSNSPLLIGFVEETAKVLALLLLVDHKNYRYILNGLLIGAAIGTGFAVFESSGYILLSALKYGIPEMLRTIFWRAVFAPGNHIVWAGMTGAAFIAVKKDRKFRLPMLLNAKFIGMYVLVILFHALWDTRLSQFSFYGIPILPAALTAVSWVIIFAVIKRGFRQVYETAPAAAE